MSRPDVFQIKNIRLVGQDSCEVYMLNQTRRCIKGWLISCQNGLIPQFHDQLNGLLQSTQPFQALMQLKAKYRIEVIR